MIKPFFYKVWILLGVPGYVFLFQKEIAETKDFYAAISDDWFLHLLFIIYFIHIVLHMRARIKTRNILNKRLEKGHSMKDIQETMKDMDEMDNDKIC